MIARAITALLLLVAGGAAAQTGVPDHRWEAMKVVAAQWRAAVPPPRAAAAAPPSTPCPRRVVDPRAAAFSGDGHVWRRATRSPSLRCPSECPADHTTCTDGAAFFVTLMPRNEPFAPIRSTSK